ncbi:hypothetical protein [Sphingomonas sp.]|uniref:hypothetical protein n=1 Tax=Sphingomonas sp. TaxID=28214 RepID=UPI002BE29F0A|nr:hypothetical protein [Sphingomonas sp.]HWK36694.1 hypothetical protein [Sphingomonas sp.]
MRNPTSLLLAGGLILTLAIATPAVAGDDPDGKAYEVIRAGDEEMSCEALSAEIGTLSAEQQQAGMPTRRKRGGLGVLKVLGAASPLLGMAGAGGAIASSAMGAAGSIAGSAAGGGVAPGGRSMLIGRRLQHLTEVLSRKQC